MAREKILAREGKYTSPGPLLVIASDDQGSSIATNIEGVSYRWNFTKEGVFSHISCGTESFDPTGDMFQMLIDRIVSIIEDLESESDRDVGSKILQILLESVAK